MNKIHPEVLRRFGRDPKIIFDRDGWKCLICNSKNDLTIDHIDGNGRNSKKPNNDINNLQTLCRKCHGSKDGERRSRFGNYSDSKIIKRCLICDKEIKIFPSRIKQGRGKICGKACKAKYFSNLYKVR